jgi:broad specificity phosphatase PhoE
MPPALTWLVRHGQSTSNAGLQATRFDDVPLTALGHQQALEVANRVQRQPDVLIVSPFLRAHATAEPIRARWPLARCETWPIHELTYLSPARCHASTVEMRRPLVEAYWLLCDPDYRDGPDAEPFRSFMTRLLEFHHRLISIDDDFVVVVGHGQFFRAYLLGQKEGFTVSSDWMKRYRNEETARPMANCEIVELKGEALKGYQA